MSNRSIIAVLILFALIGSTSLAQRVLPPVQTITDYRPLGERRLWTFVAHDSTIGRLNSVVEEQVTINGVDGLSITENLALDFRRSGAPSVQQYVGKHFVTPSGGYLGDDLTATVNDQVGKLKLERNGELLVGYTERGGEQSAQSVAVPSSRFAWENLFVDQLEAYLALRGVREGETIDDSVFAPLTLLSMRIAGEVTLYGWERLYNQVIDSVFVINLREPQPMRLFYSKDRRLQKIEMPLQEMKIYLDLVAPRQASPQAPSTPLSWARITKLLPHIAVFLVVALLVSAFFVRGKLRPGEHYLGAVAGLIIMWLIPITQVPLQEWAITTWLLPGLKAGKSIFLLGFMPAIIAGAIQLALLTIAVLFVVSWRGLPQNRAMAAGALCGAGFGLMLASYLTYIGGESQLLFDMGFIERSFQILFHASSGLIIAVLCCRGLTSALKGAVILACINSLFYYLVVFAQQKLVDAGMLTILLAFVVLGTAVWAITLQRRSSRN